MRLVTDALNPYERRYRVPKWNGLVTALEDHRILRVIPEFDWWTRDDHRRRALRLVALARGMEQERASIAERAVAEYGDDGPLVSGVYREHFPAHVKDRLRYLCQAAAEYLKAGLAHWQAAGLRPATFRRLL